MQPEPRKAEALRELKPMWSPTFKVRAWLFGGYGFLLLASQFLGVFPDRWVGLARQVIAFLVVALLLVGAIALWRAWRGPRLRLAVAPRVLHVEDLLSIAYAVEERGSGKLRRFSMTIEQRRYSGMSKQSRFNRSAVHDAPFERLSELPVLQLSAPEGYGWEEADALDCAGEVPFLLPSTLKRTYRSERAWFATLLLVRAEFSRGPRLEQEFELILHRAPSASILPGCSPENVTTPPEAGPPQSA